MNTEDTVLVICIAVLLAFAAGLELSPYIRAVLATPNCVNC